MQAINRKNSQGKNIDNIKQKATTFNKSSKVDHAHECRSLIMLDNQQSNQLPQEMMQKQIKV